MGKPAMKASTQAKLMLFAHHLAAAAAGAFIFSQILKYQSKTGSKTLPNRSKKTPMPRSRAPTNFASGFC